MPEAGAARRNSRGFSWPNVGVRMVRSRPDLVCTKGCENVETKDFVVVGAATDACLVGNRLSAQLRNCVLFLEAGAPHNYVRIQIPVGYLYSFGDRRCDRLVDIQPEPDPKGRQIRCPRGRIWRAFSSMIALIFMPRRGGDDAKWAETWLGWTWDEVLFRTSENTGTTIILTALMTTRCTPISANGRLQNNVRDRQMSRLFEMTS